MSPVKNSYPVIGYKENNKNSKLLVYELGKNYTRHIASMLLLHKMYIEQDKNIGNAREKLRLSLLSVQGLVNKLNLGIDLNSFSEIETKKTLEHDSAFPFITYDSIGISTISNAIAISYGRDEMIIFDISSLIAKQLVFTGIILEYSNDKELSNIIPLDIAKKESEILYGYNSNEINNKVDFLHIDCPKLNPLLDNQTSIYKSIISIEDCLLNKISNQ